jgi:ABC-type transporter Mla maintaining outer membrane lipid asymmetry ATPase subunit MlaF
MNVSTTAAPVALRVSGLGFQVGGAEILTGIDLEVREGSFLGII